MIDDISPFSGPKGKKFLPMPSTHSSKSVKRYVHVVDMCAWVYVYVCMYNIMTIIDQYFSSWKYSSQNIITWHMICHYSQTFLFNIWTFVKFCYNISVSVYSILQLQRIDGHEYCCGWCHNKYFEWLVITVAKLHGHAITFTLVLFCYSRLSRIIMSLLTNAATCFDYYNRYSYFSIFVFVVYLYW